MIMTRTDFPQSTDLFYILVKPCVQALPLDVHLLRQILDL